MMIKNEADILNYLLSRINTSSKDVIKSIGDDCAVIKASQKRYLVITTDTSLQGPHFTEDYSSFEIGYKCLATNLSDIAAMGCIPKYILMAITIPSIDTAWIKGFYKGIKKLSVKHNIALIGGDTNKGPLSISIQVIGENKSKIIYRDKAKINDDIYVTGKIGLARAALMIKNKKRFLNEFKILKKYLHTPIPRIEIGLEISRYAHSCIDLSDGISKDLTTIIQQSNLGADIFIEKIPTLKFIKTILPEEQYYESLIGGGEDYELCFTASVKNRENIKKISKKLKTPITIIGKTTNNSINYYLNKELINLNIVGFDHFS